MKYANGQEVRLGDKVRLWSNCYGVVVCSMDAGDYSSAFPKQDWQYLTSGVIIKTEKAGLIHYIEPDEDFELYFER